MSAPHDAPSVEQMVEAVREWIEADLMAATEGRTRFHARVAANMLAIVERELQLGAAQAAAHDIRLARLGVDDDRELAARIRAGDYADRGAELRAILRADVVDKLLVANPDYLEAEDRVGPGASATG